MKNEHGLTQQREKFARCVAEGMSGADAYRAAFKVGRMSDKHVYDEASKLLSSPEVARRVAALQAELADRSVLKAEDVLKATRQILLASPAKLVKVWVDDDGKQRVTWLLPHELDPDTAAAVAGVEVDDLGRVKYKFWDKNVAADRAARLLGMYQKDNDQRARPWTEFLAAVQGKGGAIVTPLPSAALPDDDDDDGP